MIENEYKPPKFGEKAFHCPHCGVLATQTWSNDESFRKDLFECQHDFFLNYREKIGWEGQHYIQRFLDEVEPKILNNSNRPYFLVTCTHCNDFSFWVNEKMVYPLVPTSPPPHEDMPEDVKKTYEEARQVQPFSVRASAALLRVSLEQLTVHLGETKGNLNTRIANLKKKGLPSRIIKSLDILRIYANEGGAHAGTIDLEGKDNEDTVLNLYKLINNIVYHTIASDKMVDDLYDGIPDAKKEGIKNRDSNN